MKRFSSATLLWLAISASVICAGCRPPQPDAAPADKPSATEPAKQKTEAPAAAPAAAEDKLFSLSEPAKPEAEAAPTAPAKPEAAAPALAPDTILVKVNDKTITQGDLDKETKAVEKMMRQRGLSAQQFASMLTTFKPQILDGLVTQSLIEDECAAKKIVVADADVKKEIDSIKAGLPKNGTLEAILLQQGITQSVLEDQITDQLKIEKLLNVKVSDQDVKKFYADNKARLFETVRARHILIKVDPTDDAAKKTIKKEKAEQLRKELVGGGDFAKLAKDNSDCPSKDNGGELTPAFRRGQMVKPFETVAFSQKPNEISEVVETDFGYHIIQTLEIQIQPFDEVKGRIAAMLKGKQTQQEAEPMIKSLKEKAKITYLNGATPPPPPKSMFQPSGAGDAAMPVIVKPEAKAETKAEIKKEAKPEVKKEAKADAKKEAKPAVKAEAKPDAKAKPVAKPEDKASATTEKPADQPKK